MSQDLSYSVSERFGNNPESISATNENELYIFHIDLILPTINSIFLNDHILEEYFDLYMVANEVLIDFQNDERPLNLWIYYNDHEDVSPEIFFPDIFSNNIY